MRKEASGVVCGRSDRFSVGVGSHQGSTLNSVLFVMVMDRLMDEVRPESPWTVVFGDDREKGAGGGAWRGGSMVWREEE